MFFKKVSNLDVLMFTKHLAVMVKSGVPLSEALSALGSEAKSNSFKKIIAAIHEQVVSGSAFHTALSKHSEGIFDEFYVGLVKVADESGTLEESLAFLAKYMAKDYALGKKVQGALYYPVLVFAATFIMGGAIAFFILPQLIDFFSAFDTELPLATKVLLFMAEFTKNYGLVSIGVMFGVLFLFLWALKNATFRNKFDQFLLVFPLLGKVIRYGQLSKLSRNIGVLLKNGVTINRAFEVSSETVTNSVYKRALLDLSNTVKKGKLTSSTLKETYGGTFPPIFVEMIRVGEKTGSLDEVLEYLGDFYEEEIDDISKNLSTILEPALLLIIGLVVAFVALAIISPIYELTGSLG